MLWPMQDGAGPRPYDVSVGHLIELDPEGWLDWIGLPADGPVESVETDVSTVLAEVDKVLLVRGPKPWLAHIEIQSSRDPHLPARLLQYFGLLHYKNLERARIAARIETAVVLLRPEADGPELRGTYAPQGTSGPTNATMEFHVVRLWERPVEELLTGGIGVSPLAPLASLDRALLASIVSRVHERFRQETDPSTESELRNALLLLLSLRYDEDEVRAMMVELAQFRDTPVYRVIAEEGRKAGREEGREEGRLAEARRLLEELGAEKLGPPDEVTAATLARLDDVERLNGLLHRLLKVQTWQELLTAEPGR